MEKKKPMTAAERKRKQRERDKRLGMAEMKLNLARTERQWIEKGAEARGYDDRTEYLLSLVRHDLKNIENVTGHDNVS